MSVLVPFSGVLLTSPLRSSGAHQRLAPRLLAAAVLAVAYAVFGVVVSGLALALAGSAAVGGGWQHAGSVLVGSVLVQVIAQLTGTGLGMLVRPAALAMAATIVLPLGLWLLLGAVDVLRPAQAWLTPFPTAGNLLSGAMPPLGWAQSLVVVLIWNVSLNAQGAMRVGR
jgi:hypothetical protein